MSARIASGEPPRVAVVGTGVAGSACAAALLRAGVDATAFDKSRGVGGRMATRRVDCTPHGGVGRTLAFDHGCGPFEVTRPRFAAEIDRVAALGGAARWRRRVYAEFPSPREHEVVVPTPDMPALCRHLLAGVPLRLGHAVAGLERSSQGWWLASPGRAAEGPFDQVVLALPPAQSAALIAGHDEAWAAALAEVPMAPCWTLLAVTDDLDWPWDAAEVTDGELAWIARGDRAPGRVAGSGVPWVAHARADWSRIHLEDDPAAVRDVLRSALGRLLGGVPDGRWRHLEVHRWRYARGPQASREGAARNHRFDRNLRLATCGDAFGDGVEAAWGSGDDLGAALIASLRDRPTAPRPARVSEAPGDAARPAASAGRRVAPPRPSPP